MQKNKHCYIGFTHKHKQTRIQGQREKVCVKETFIIIVTIIILTNINSFQNLLIYSGKKMEFNLYASRQYLGVGIGLGRGIGIGLGISINIGTGISIGIGISLDIGINIDNLYRQV